MAGLALRARALRKFSISSTVTRPSTGNSCLLSILHLTSTGPSQRPFRSHQSSHLSHNIQQVWNKGKEEEVRGGGRRRGTNKEGSSTHHGEGYAPRRVSGTVPSLPPPSVPAHPIFEYLQTAGNAAGNGRRGPEPERQSGTLPSPDGCCRRGPVCRRCLKYLRPARPSLAAAAQASACPAEETAAGAAYRAGQERTGQGSPVSRGQRLRGGWRPPRDFPGHADESPARPAARSRGPAREWLASGDAVLIAPADRNLMASTSWHTRPHCPLSVSQVLTWCRRSARLTAHTPHGAAMFEKVRRKGW